MATIQAKKGGFITGASKDQSSASTINSGFKKDNTGHKPQAHPTPGAKANPLGMSAGSKQNSVLLPGQIKGHESMKKEDKSPTKPNSNAISPRQMKKNSLKEDKSKTTPVANEADREDELLSHKEKDHATEVSALQQGKKDKTLIAGSKAQPESEIRPVILDAEPGQVGSKLKIVGLIFTIFLLAAMVVYMGESVIIAIHWADIKVYDEKVILYIFEVVTPGITGIAWLVMGVFELLMFKKLKWNFGMLAFIVNLAALLLCLGGSAYMFYLVCDLANRKNDFSDALKFLTSDMFSASDLKSICYLFLAVCIGAGFGLLHLIVVIVFFCKARKLAKAVQQEII